MPIKANGRFLLPFLGLLLLGLPALTGCEKADTISDKDAKFLLYALPTAACPDQNATDKMGSTNLTATVYAQDGAVGKGFHVTFSTDNPDVVFSLPSTGTASSASMVTDNTFSAVTGESGQVTVIAKAPRPVGDQINFTARLDNGLTATLKKPVYWPYPPNVYASAAPSSVEVGKELTLTISTSSVCNLSGINLALTWDATQLDYIPDPENEKKGSALSDTTIDGTATNDPNLTTLVTNAAPGSLQIDFRRIDGKGITISAGNASLLKFRFKGLKESPDVTAPAVKGAQMKLTSATVFSTIPPDFVIPITDTTRWAASQIIVIKATTTSKRR